MNTTTMAALTAAALTWVPALHAQSARADALLRAGRLAAAESAYYAASDARPRDPGRRAALGWFLAARGAPRVGAVLLEEARQFGGDPVAIARQLAPIYRRLADYRALAHLEDSPLTAAERAQAAWLASHAPSATSGDSTIVALRRSTIAVSLGRMDLDVGGVKLDADIDPRGGGLTVDEAWRPRAAALFGGGRTSARLGVLRVVRLGEFVLHDVPVRFAALGARNRAVLGLDVIARFAPTANPHAGTLVLHGSDDVPVDSAMHPLPTLTDAQGTRVLLNGHWLPLTDPQVLERMRAEGWALDQRQGELTLR